MMMWFGVNEIKIGFRVTTEASREWLTSSPVQNAQNVFVKMPLREMKMIEPLKSCGFLLRSQIMLEGIDGGAGGHGGRWWLAEGLPDYSFHLENQ